MTKIPGTPSRLVSRLGAALVIALALQGACLAGGAMAQTPLPVAQAAEFMGRWNVAVETDMGPFEVVLNIQDSEGKTVASVGTPEGDVSVTDISRTGDQLVLKYGFAGPEGEIPIVVNLQRDGENLKTTMDVGGGMFSAAGVGRRAPQ